MIYKYGIDFGTTNSSIALCSKDKNGVIETHVFDMQDSYPYVTLPSVVYINGNLENSYIGNEAKRRFSVQDEETSRNSRNIFIKRVKMLLEESAGKLEYSLNRKNISAAQVISLLLKQLKEEADDNSIVKRLKPHGVVLGVPVEYGDVQKKVLIEALYLAGYYSDFNEAMELTEFVSEPVAVAVDYGVNLQGNKTVLVFDFGGGTLDLAILKMKSQGNSKTLIPHEVLAKSRLTLGGEEITRKFFINSFCSDDKYGFKYLQKKLKFRYAETPDDLFEELSQKYYGIDLIDKVDYCKCELSRQRKTKFHFSGPNGMYLNEMEFSRQDLKMAISDELSKIETLIDNCLDDAGIEDYYDIDNVVVAGGSALITSVLEVLQDKFGPEKVLTKTNDTGKEGNNFKPSDVLTSVVRGLATVGCNESSLVEDVVDCDYGVWDTKKDVFLPIVDKGTPVKSTILDRLTMDGQYILAEADRPNVTKINVQVYQRNLNGEERLGTIVINNPGGKKYRIYMQVDPKKGRLTVHFYDEVKKSWKNDIPLEQREYNINS